MDRVKQLLLRLGDHLPALVVFAIMISWVVVSVECGKSLPEPPRRPQIIAVVDGTAHPFRDTLVVYRDRVQKAPPDTVVKYIRRWVHDTVWTDSLEVDSIMVPVEVVRKVAVRIVDDSIRIYTDSTRHHYDSLTIHDLQMNCTGVDTVKPTFMEKAGYFSEGALAGGIFGWIIGAFF